MEYSFTNSIVIIIIMTMLPIRFIKRLEIQKQSGCWKWSGTVNRNGYGLTKEFRNGKYITTTCHRFAWKCHYGSIPNGKCVLHKCDNPSCCNPEHLFIGTHKDNTNDMIAKGRGNPILGEAHKNAKLMNNKVMQIRRLREDGIKQTELGKMFGIGQDHISRIVNRKLWKHI